MNYFVLVVDDKEINLDNRIDMLSDQAIPIRAKSLSEAKQKFLDSPAVDCVITDINLEGGYEHRFNRDGVELLRLVRRIRPEVPVAGYSTYKVNDGLEASDDFDLFQEKTSSYEAKEKFIQIAEQKALEHALQRVEQAHERVARLGAKYDLDDSDIRIIHSLGSLGDIQNEAGPDYELRVVYTNEEPYWHVDGWKLKRPVLVWIGRLSDGVRVSIYQHPNLMAQGTGESDAITNLFSALRRTLLDEDEMAGLSISDQNYLRSSYERPEHGR